ncbi:unnamed protein product [Caenorhabditis angaria]|uniref:Uncharacterized protein n=1 Tax=Caenorhabditis angaria TaxID=860376 RepID=A0A9P1IX03_9PELO|nr:unnamed protein product [Caenorhabditis angaria]
MVLSMMTLTMMNGLGLIECLLQGTFIETQKVKILPRRQVWNQMGLISGFIIEASQFMVLIERLIGVRFTNFRSSPLFFPFFTFSTIFLYSCSIIYVQLLYGNDNQRNIALIMTNSMVSISLFISETYEICRGLVPASIYRLMNRLFILTFLWMNFIGYNLKLDDILNFFFFINIARSSESLIFPALFILLHRKLHRRFNRIFCHYKKKKETFFNFRGLNGKRLTINRSQNEHFERLSEQWRILY